MVVEVRCEVAGGHAHARALGADARRLMRLVALEGCELSLMLAGDGAVRALNRRFRGKDGPTDVLSFSQLEEARGAGRRGRLPRGLRAATGTGPCARALGDVVISLDTARRQARAMKATLKSRLRTLLIHGFLHLLGYDHERSAAAARAMFAHERELAARLAGYDARPAAAAGGPARRGNGR